MTRTFDPVAERDGSAWPLLAASILSIQGLSTLIFASLLPAPLTNAGVDVPVLGTMPFIWIAIGIVALVSGAGVAARLTWARYLGSVSAVIAMASGLYNAHTVTLLPVILPGIVLFVLWRKWPANRAA